MSSSGLGTGPVLGVDVQAVRVGGGFGPGRARLLAGLGFGPGDVHAGFASAHGDGVVRLGRAGARRVVLVVAQVRRGQTEVQIGSKQVVVRADRSG
ncbi:hypothetical protein ACGFIF_28640 [Kribbella sp. NPDC049174]|uniref:hypothetical protein n=1 Tax=Kribbella sp. NPDC049174 TaxID=3364112 RepID=UPI0037212880